MVSLGSCNQSPLRIPRGKLYLQKRVNHLGTALISMFQNISRIHASCDVNGGSHPKKKKKTKSVEFGETDKQYLASSLISRLFRAFNRSMYIVNVQVGTRELSSLTCFGLRRPYSRSILYDLCSEECILVKTLLDWVPDLKKYFYHITISQKISRCF